MKNITSFILETINSSSSQFKDVDLTGIPQSSRNLTPGSKEALTLAAQQEDFVVNALNSMNYLGYTYQRNTGTTSSNLKDGDIIIRSTDDEGYDNIIATIDLKVARASQSSNLLGSIDVNSILNFANQPNHFYLCVNKDGSKKELFSSEYIMSIFNNEQCIYKSTRSDRDTKVKPNIQKYADKVVKEFDGDKWVQTTSEDISLYDFMPSAVFNSVSNKAKYNDKNYQL